MDDDAAHEEHSLSKIPVHQWHTMMKARLLDDYDAPLSVPPFKLVKRLTLRYEHVQQVLAEKNWSMVGRVLREELRQESSDRMSFSAMIMTRSPVREDVDHVARSLHISEDQLQFEMEQYTKGEIEYYTTGENGTGTDVQSMIERADFRALAEKYAWDSYAAFSCWFLADPYVCSRWREALSTVEGEWFDFVRLNDFGRVHYRENAKARERIRAVREVEAQRLDAVRASAKARVRAQRERIWQRSMRTSPELTAEEVDKVFEAFDSETMHERDESDDRERPGKLRKGNAEETSQELK